MRWFCESNKEVLEKDRVLPVGSIACICRWFEGYVMRQNVILCCQIISLDEANNKKQVVCSQAKNYCNGSQGIPQPDRVSQHYT
jgi:hypothetical protein